MKIRFSKENVSFRIKDAGKIKKWLEDVLLIEKKTGDSIFFIFCSDESLYEKNLAFLSHKTYTDIITFDYSNDLVVSGEIYISVDRIKENAVKFAVPEAEELKRVMVHGVLHLCGYKDKTKAQKVKMRRKENAHLNRFPR